MRFMAIILLCIVAAVLYGVVHDQITARICVEYFTIGHPPIFNTQDPTLLGLGWGVVATWWVGLLLGVPLAIVCRVGPWPKIEARRLLRPLVCLLLIVGGLAVLAGLAGHLAASRGWVRLLGPIATRVPPDRHVAFLTDLWAHSASYLFGFLGGVALCIGVLLSRRQPYELKVHDTN